VLERDKSVCIWVYVSMCMCVPHAHAYGYEHGRHLTGMVTGFVRGEA
jgi:hypothetical protein